MLMTGGESSTLPPYLPVGRLLSPTPTGQVTTLDRWRRLDRGDGDGGGHAVDPRADPHLGVPPLRRERLRRHVAERQPRRRRHPPAEPAPPLPVEGGALPRGLR